MEALDREIAEALIDTTPHTGSASILIVHPEGSARDQLVDMIEAQQHRCICIGRLDTAKATITRGRFDLILINPDLPDGDGLSLTFQLRGASGFATESCIAPRNWKVSERGRLRSTK